MPATSTPSLTNMLRPPRKLSFLKCARCRKDRQKCTPLDRPWPSQRCDRCIKFDYPCSGNVTTRGEPQKDPNISQGKQPVRPDRNIEGQTSSSISDVGPPSNLNAPSTAESTAPKISPSTIPLDGISTGAQPRPKCAELFRTLAKANWSYPVQPSSSEHQPEDPAIQALAGMYMYLMKESTRNVHIRLQRRELLMVLHQEHRKLVEEKIAQGIPQNKAVKLATANFILEVSQGTATDGEDLSATDFVVSVVHNVREGERWQELIDAVGTQEILLIGRDSGEHYDKDDDDYDENEIPDAWSLEKRFCKNYKSMNIAKITMSGTDHVFAKMKELLLMPDLQLKETCQRLSGLSQLIKRLREVEESSGDKYILPHLNKDLPKPKDDPNSKLGSFLASEIQRRIGEVLGEPEPESDAETDDEETSGNEDDPEEICESDEGDRDRGFGDDFCINFKNSNAFSSDDWMNTVFEFSP